MVDKGEKGAYDLLILGGGSAAFSAAIRASELGKTAAMIERGTIGGTCVNVGCVPSKQLLATGETYRAAQTNPFKAPGASCSAAQRSHSARLRRT